MKDSRGAELKGKKSVKKELGYLVIFLLGAACAVFVTLFVLWKKGFFPKASESSKEVLNYVEKAVFLDASGKTHVYETKAGNKNVYDKTRYKIDGESLYDKYGSVLEMDLGGQSVSASSLPETKGLLNTHIGYLDGHEISYEDGTYKSRMGIDVSYHQGDIDWNKVASSGVKFVYIRCGYRGYAGDGVLKEDTKFEEYYKGAKKAGLDVGVYFFSQAINESEAKEEAEFTLKLLKGKELDLPVVFDPENVGGVGARTDSVSGEQFTKNTIEFCDAVEKGGFKSAVYANMIWQASKLDMTKLRDIEMWYADYEPLPQTPYDFTTWQYSATGRVDGISGDVDLDLEIRK
ncbi:MAG: glycoside hydrolase family 25 protein [Lachnospiraceae bacterium]|nr:glycoside hydrolase family 25 protein [Lachnospiraceae bacterium]